MPINRDFVGRTYPSERTYEVGREKIREFADAIGDANPIYRDRDAAVAAGHPDVIAPPTFPITISLGGGALADPDLGLDFLRVVHGEQRFVYARPVRAGDVLGSTATVTEIRDAGRNELLTIATELRTADGELVCTTYNTIISRGTAAGQ